MKCYLQIMTGLVLMLIGYHTDLFAQKPPSLTKNEAIKLAEEVITEEIAEWNHKHTNKLNTFMLRRKVKVGKSKKQGLALIKVYYRQKPSRKYQPGGLFKRELWIWYNPHKLTEDRATTNLKYEVKSWETYFRLGKAFVQVNEQSIMIIRWKRNKPIEVYKHFFSSQECTTFIKLMRGVKLNQIESIYQKQVRHPMKAEIVLKVNDKTKELNFQGRFTEDTVIGRLMRTIRHWLPEL